MATKVESTRNESPLTARCRRIRQGWSDSEKRMRALRANLAQSRLALAILFRDTNAGCLK